MTYHWRDEFSMRGVGQLVNRPKVYKARLVYSIRDGKRHAARVTDRPWVVVNHPCGNKRFDTWREAYDYARSRPVMVNPLDGL